MTRSKLPAKLQSSSRAALYAASAFLLLSPICGCVLVGGYRSGSGFFVWPGTLGIVLIVFAGVRAPQTLALRGSMRTKELIPILKTTFTAWNRHEAPRLGAALAFYTILSLSPLVIIVVAVGGLIFSRSTAQTHILSQVQAMIGPEGGKAVQSMLANAQKPAAGILGTIVGLLSLLFGASGVFAELRSALNLLWEVKPEETSGIVGLLRERFFSFGMVLSIGFLLLVSLVLSTVLAALGKFFGGFLPIPSPVLAVFNFLISYVGVTVLFGLIFRFVPEAKVRWRNVWPGALVTAMFFTIGKTLIGLYLGKSSVGSTYGAAGSVIVVIVWVYYSAQIFFFGAEFTHAYAEQVLPATQDDSGAVNRKTAA